jgi:hypothetical protein
MRFYVSMRVRERGVEVLGAGVQWVQPPAVLELPATTAETKKTAREAGRQSQTPQV